MARALSPAGKSGDEVTLYSLVTCGDCEFCRAGEVTVSVHEHQIIGEHMDGGLAEYMLAPARNLIPKPKRNLSHVEVAALPVVAGTAWHMLITVARLAGGRDRLHSLAPVAASPPWAFRSPNTPARLS